MISRLREAQPARAARRSPRCAARDRGDGPAGIEARGGYRGGEGSGPVWRAKNGLCGYALSGARDAQRLVKVAVGGGGALPSTQARFAAVTSSQAAVPNVSPSQVT